MGKFCAQSLVGRWRQAGNVPPLTSQLPAREHGARYVRARCTVRSSTLQHNAHRPITERAVDSTVGAGSSPELDMAPLNLVTFLGDKTKLINVVTFLGDETKMPLAP